MHWDHTRVNETKVKNSSVLTSVLSIYCMILLTHYRNLPEQIKPFDVSHVLFSNIVHSRINYINNNFNFLIKIFPSQV